MAFLTSEPISKLAVELLARNLVLPGTVTRVPVSDYRGPSGGTVTLNVPQPRSANEQATPGTAITYANLSEVGVNVALAHWYDAASITDEELSLELVEFGRQVLLPQVTSVALAAEDQVAAVMNALAADASLALTADPADTEDKILAARQALTIADVPLGDRYMAVAPDVATRILSVPKFVQVADRGEQGALADATIGKLYGFSFVESNALDAGTAVAYHRSGFAWGNAAPSAAPGADSFTHTAKGVSLRHVLDFDPSTLSTASIVSVFAGAAVIDANRVYKIDTATS